MALKRFYIFHTFNGGQLGNQLRLTHDLSLFSKQFDYKFVCISPCLYKQIFSRKPFFFYSLIRHRPHKYLYLFYLHLNLSLFRFLLCLLRLFPLINRYLAVFIPASDVEYFGFNVSSANSFYILDSSFSKSLKLFSFLWGYNYFYASRVINDFTIDTKLANMFKKKLRVHDCLSVSASAFAPYILVHLRRAHNFAVSTDSDLSDASFISSILSLSRKIKISSLRISSDGSAYSCLLSSLSDLGFTVSIASSCASMNGTPFDFLTEFYHSAAVVAPPSTLSVFYSQLFSKSLHLLRTRYD